MPKPKKRKQKTNSKRKDKPQMPTSPEKIDDLVSRLASTAQQFQRELEGDPEPKTLAEVRQPANEAPAPAPAQGIDPSVQQQHFLSERVSALGFVITQLGMAIGPKDNTGLINLPLAQFWYKATLEALSGGAGLAEVKEMLGFEK